MKKRIAAAALCLLLAFQISAPPAEAAGSYAFFMAVGDSILPFSEQTMPFWDNGYLYVDSDIFTDAGWTALRVARTLSNNDTQLILYSRGQSLWFEKGQSYAYDLEGGTYTPGCIERYGRIFVPAAVVAQFFDLLYSVTDVRLRVEGQKVSGQLVWIRRPGSIMKDQEFFAAATFAIASRYEDYLREKEDRSGEELPETPPDGTELEGRSVCLCLRAGDETAALLNTLDSYRAQAAFFCAPAFLEEQGDLLRRMAATGQGIGILVDAADGEWSVEAQLEAGNRALERATWGRTRLVMVEHGGEEALRAVRELGYRCLTPDLDRSGEDLHTASQASALLRRISTRGGDVSVWLSDRASAAGLGAFLSAAGDMEGRCLAWTETA